MILNSKSFFVLALVFGMSSQVMADIVPACTSYEATLIQGPANQPALQVGGINDLGSIFMKARNTNGLTQVMVVDSSNVVLWAESDADFHSYKLFNNNNAGIFKRGADYYYRAPGFPSAQNLSSAIRAQLGNVSIFIADLSNSYAVGWAGGRGIFFALPATATAPITVMSLNQTGTSLDYIAERPGQIRFYGQVVSGQVSTFSVSPSNLTPVTEVAYSTPIFDLQGGVSNRGGLLGLRGSNLVYRPGSTIDTPLMNLNFNGSPISGYPMGFNDSMQAVGYANFPGGTFAFVSRDEFVCQLSALLVRTKTTLNFTSANDINEQGQIVGLISGSPVRYYFLRPLALAF